MSTPETPRTWTLVFCEDCGEMLGVQDHVRIRHEHFEHAGHRGMRFVEVYKAAPVVAERERLLDLLENWLRPASAKRLIDPLGAVESQTDAVLREYGRLEKEES